MNSHNYHLQQLNQVTNLYYNEGLTQDEISKYFGVSRSSVSMMLTEAKACGIVEISIKDPFLNNEELSLELENLFALKHCIAVPTGIRNNSEVLLKLVATRAAMFFSERMVSHSSVGVAWGTSCYEFMQAFPGDTGLCDVSVVPLIGGSLLASKEFQLNEMVRIFAEKLRGLPLFIYSPFMVETFEDKESIFSSVHFRGILEKWANLDYAVIGIGGPPDFSVANDIPHDSCASVNDIQTFPYAKRAVGNICARLYDIDGNFLECDYNAKLIGIDEAGLRNAKNVLAVATGCEKIYSIIGALKTGLIDYLVTDEITAQQLLQTVHSQDVGRRSV